MNNSYFAGIDIGSRTIELVVVDDSGNTVASAKADTGFDPMSEAKRLLDGMTFDCIMATGYGRNLFELSFDAPTVTEIKAHALGVRALFPEAHGILDIGGVDGSQWKYGNQATGENGKAIHFLLILHF